MENADDGSYGGDNIINHETNVDDKNQIDERKPAATVKKIFTKRREMLEHGDQIDGMKPAADSTKKLFTNREETTEHKEEDIPSSNKVVQPT